MAAGVLEQRFVDKIAAELGCRPRQVTAAAGLLAVSGPFTTNTRRPGNFGRREAVIEAMASKTSC